MSTRHSLVHLQGPTHATWNYVKHDQQMTSTITIQLWKINILRVPAEDRALIVGENKRRHHADTMI